jgi:hypothetical protein
MNARARTSEALPSLRYVPDVAENKALAVSPRHHLVFGRRGVGKTALLLEARRQLEKEGALTLWVNMQSLRGFNRDDAFLTIALRLCDLGIGALRGENASGAVSSLKTMRTALKKCCGRLLGRVGRFQFLSHSCKALWDAFARQRDNRCTSFWMTSTTWSPSKFRGFSICSMASAATTPCG